MESVEGSRGYRAGGVSIRGKFVLWRNPGYKTGGRHVAKRIGGNSFYRAPVGKWAQETCAVCPQQRYATGEPVKAQGRDRVGIVEGSRGYRTRWVSIRRNFVLSRNPGTRLGDRHVAKRSSDPRVAYPEVKL